MSNQCSCNNSFSIDVYGLQGVEIPFVTETSRMKWMRMRVYSRYLFNRVVIVEAAFQSLYTFRSINLMTKMSRTINRSIHHTPDCFLIVENPTNMLKWDLQNKAENNFFDASYRLIPLKSTNSFKSRARNRKSGRANEWISTSVRCVDDHID